MGIRAVAFYNADFAIDGTEILSLIPYIFHEEKVTCHLFHVISACGLAPFNKANRSPLQKIMLSILSLYSSLYVGHSVEKTHIIS